MRVATFATICYAESYAMTRFKLKIRRLPNEGREFKGDRIWQVAPYPEDTKEGLEKRLSWLKKNILKGIPFEYKIVAA
jgi:hypothetical protein